ncbi:MAG: DedA family protein [Chloroflexi bacterium]|nr:DedA family protein [Chloroflexota bacterium]
MSELSDSLLTLLAAYGYPVVGIVTFVGALGVPLPATVVLIASGAFLAETTLELTAVVLLALGAAVTGDLAAYAAGRWGGHAAIRRYGSKVGLTPDLVSRACDYFTRSGSVAILLTRFLVTPLALPINLLAGATSFPLYRFLLFDVLGEGIWVTGYVGAGHALGANWETALSFLTDSTSALTLALAAAGLVYLSFRLLRPARPPDSLPKRDRSRSCLRIPADDEMPATSKRPVSQHDHLH